MMDSIRLEKAQFVGDYEYENEIPFLNWLDDLNLEFTFKVIQLKEIPRFVITIFDKEQRPVAVLEDNKKNNDINIIHNKIKFIVSHSNLQLSKGIYSLNITLLKRNSSGPILRINDFLCFHINHPEDIWQPFLLKSNFKPKV